MIKHDKTVSHRINRNKNHEQFVSNKADVPSNGLIMGFQPIPSPGEKRSTAPGY